MKITCNKEKLINGINIVQKAVSMKTSLTILEGILLKADKEFILTGNDLEIAIETKVEANIIVPGTVVINSRIFGDIVRKLPDSEVEIEIENEDKVIINCEKVHFEIKGMSAENYPGIQSVDKENCFSINQNILKDMIRKTIFAVSIDDNRPILTGSLIECSDDKIVMVSIDGFRLALRKEKIDEAELKKVQKVVIPGKTLLDVQKIIDDEERDINIYASKNQVLFEMKDTIVVSRLLEGEYLNYNGIIPAENETSIVVNKRDFLYSLERASLVIPADDRRYPVIFKIKDDMINITAKTTIGTVDEEISTEMNGKELEIGFNPRYFIDALKAIEDEAVKINFTTEIGPCTINPIEGEKYKYMLLPVRR